MRPYYHIIIYNILIRIASHLDGYNRGCFSQVWLINCWLLLARRYQNCIPELVTCVLVKVKMFEMMQLCSVLAIVHELQHRS